MRKKKFLLLLVTVAAVLQSCAPGAEDEIPHEEPESPQPLPSAVVTVEEDEVLGDGKFTLRYNPSASFNPFTGTDKDNMALVTLMYEGLFALNADFTARNVLCEGYSTDDGITYRFALKSGVAMSDGSTLNAYDVKYSLDQARASDKYKSRLRIITAVTVTGNLEVTVTLLRAHATLPVLLDIPIVKYGYSGTVPPGSGPYRYNATDGNPRLELNVSHRDAERLPIDTIWLVKCDDTQVGEYFTSYIIDLLADDPNESQPLRIHRDHETRYYNTTTLQFIGFNPRTSAISDSRIRRVISLAVDRGYIVSELLGGRALASPLALSPAYSLYDESWESELETGDMRVEMSSLLREAGLRDDDNDSWFEYPTESGSVKIELSFIVPRENAARVAAARSVCDNLRRIGINVTLRQLSFDEYKAALAAGEFDLFYAETRLTADFDLLQIIAPGGSLNFGNMGGSAAADLARAFSAAQDEQQRGEAARELCQNIEQNTTFIPVAYLQYAVHTGRGTVQGIEVSQTGVFVNIADWKIAVDSDN